MRDIILAIVFSMFVIGAIIGISMLSFYREMWGLIY